MHYNQFITGQYLFNWRVPEKIDPVVEGELALIFYKIGGRSLIATNGMGLRRNANGHACEYFLEYKEDEKGAIEMLNLIIGYQKNFNFVALDGESIEGGDLISTRYTGKNHLLFIEPDKSICLLNEFVYKEGWNIILNQLALIDNQELEIIAPNREYKRFINEENIQKYTVFP